MLDENPPAAELWAMVDLVTPMALRVTATLRVADYIARGVRTVDQIGVLAEDCGLRAATVHPAGASAVVALIPSTD